ncbi:Uncharacterised protein [Mycobacteroides abscessus subsp. abscessus]|nr:Uncharacterised protein [Mycobacteroides abscessus subsp. abscessus]
MDIMAAAAIMTVMSSLATMTPTSVSLMPKLGPLMMIPAGVFIIVTRAMRSAVVGYMDSKASGV